uniref:Uncharacterized protein n=1 Tax=Tanacetum cinerariifolium TaxID=118510 RepID=A0A699HEK2_TANCI|nr:hypothetical protein [Tanacetum cinerariifolium]
MDATGGSGRLSPGWLIVDDNGAVDTNDTMDNLEDRIANLEMVFAYLKIKKMLERQKNKLNKGSPTFDYVYYPSTNLFNRLSQPEYSYDDSHFDVTVVLRISFDPTKSLDYKVAQLFALTNSDLEIHVYSSKTGNSSLCRDREDKQLALYKFNIDDHDHLIITTIEIPNGFNQGRNFLQSYGGRKGSYDPMLEQIDIPGILHMQGRLFESSGCLLLVCRDVINSREFTIYEMVKGVLCGRLDLKLNSKKSNMDHSFGSVEEVDHVRILQVCNRLLLCTGSTWPVFYYVYNPSTNLFKSLSQPNYFLRDESCFYSSGVFRLAFDPRKLLHYKVVHAGRPSGLTQIQIYSSETRCRDRFSYFSFDHFESVIYWNDAFHWLKGLNRELKHCKLYIEDHDHPIMISSEISYGLHRGTNFLDSFGGPSNDPILLLMKIPHMLHHEGKFVKSCGCLLLVCRDDIGYKEFTIYEMMKGSFVWSVKYFVSIEQLMNPLPEGWSTRTYVWSICLGEGEEDGMW